MAAKTYGDVINSVMTKLRETAVTTLSDDYTLLIGEWVNTIKEEIEDSWDWQAGRKVVSFDSVVDQREYDLSDADTLTSTDVTNTRSRLMMEKTMHGLMPLMFDVTLAGSSGGYRLIQVPDSSRRARSMVDTQITTSQPQHFSIYANTDGLQFAFRESPEAVRNYSGVFYIPDEELESLSDTFHIPYRPLRLGVLWIAAQERGEELGLDSNTLFMLYQSALAKAIATDMEESDAIMVPV